MGRAPALAGLCAGLVCACANMLGPTPALARAGVARTTGDARTTRDVRATRAYLRAAAAYARSNSAAVGASVAAIAARGSAIAGECPSSLTYAPRDEAFEELGEEAHKTLLDAGTEPTRAARQRFAHAVGKLKWSDRHLTRLVREQAAEELAPATIALPNVCADIAAWKASAYATLPPSTERFLGPGGKGVLGSLLESLLVLFETPRQIVIARLLRPFEDRRELLAATRIEAQEAQVSRELGSADRTAGVALAAELGVTAL
jgi:hypothetical protein